MTMEDTTDVEGPAIHEGPMPRHVWEQRGPPRWRLCGMHMEDDLEAISFRCQGGSRPGAPGWEQDCKQHCKHCKRVHLMRARMEAFRLCIQFNLVMGTTFLIIGAALM